MQIYHENPVDILAFGAHPDDVEFGAGGILLKMAAKGYKIAIVDLTSGGMGTHGSTQEREEEGLKAAKFYNAKRIFLRLDDCGLQDTPENRVKLTYWIRQFRPKLILSPDFQNEMNHPDHSALGKMARHAMRYARFRKILPEIEPHRAGGILHYHYPQNREPDFIINITEQADAWKKLMAAFPSQLKTMDYIDRNFKAAAYFGSLIGVPYAQGLSKHNPIEVDDLMVISRATIEI